MNIIQIRTFILTAECGSLSQVARIMGKSRTALSTSLANLEEELGIKLFHRTKNKLVVSVAGQELLPDCRSITNIVDNIYAKSLQLSEGVKNNICIAYDDSLPNDFWRSQITKISLVDHESTLSIIRAPSPDLPILIKDKRVDIAFGLMLNTTDDPNLNVKLLHRVRMMVICAHNHPLAMMEKVTSVEISTYRQVVLGHQSDNITPNIEPVSSSYIRFSSYHEILDAVRDQLGWAVVPEPLIRKELRNGTLQVIKHTNGMHYENFAEISRPNEQSPELAQQLAENIEEGIFDIL